MSRLIKQMAVLFVSALATLPTYALDGDTLVPTKTGHKAIKDIQLGELVLSKNETTNQVDYQSVSNLYNDQSTQTVYVSIGDNQGNFQTLKTSKTHPFFVQSDDITPSSEGYVYQGDIKNANWTDASSLKVGDKLLSENGTWQTVQSVQINQEPITAYHLTVNNNHTFFVTANGGKYGAWVHNNTSTTTDEAVKKRREAYLKHSPNWASGSFKTAYGKFTPRAKGVISDDKVKTRYTSSDGKHTIIKDNENNYYRIYDNTKKQYLDNNGNLPSTGTLKGQAAKDYVQQQTHIRNTDK